MPLEIWLLNPYEIRYPWDELRQNVKTLMEPVVAKRDEGKKVKYGHVHVHSRYIKPTIGPNDLAVYVVPAKEFGFVGVSFGNGMREHGDGLTTHKSGQACSEIYLGRQVVKTPTNGAVLIKADRLTNEHKGVWVNERYTPQTAANLVFHELLHNVTPSWDEYQLHGTAKVSLGQESVSHNTPQSGKDIEILAEHMQKVKHTQWTGAWTAMSEPPPDPD